MENGDLIYIALKAFSHVRPVINLEPLNDRPACHFFRMNDDFYSIPVLNRSFPFKGTFWSSCWTNPHKRNQDQREKYDLFFHFLPLYSQDRVHPPFSYLGLIRSSLELVVKWLNFLVDPEKRNESAIPLELGWRSWQQGHDRHLQHQTALHRLRWESWSQAYLSRKSARKFPARLPEWWSRILSSH